MKSDTSQIVPLSKLCSYSAEKVLISALRVGNYISTENMLPSKRGIALASSMPAGDKACAYRKGDILVSNIRPYYKKIWRAVSDGGCSNDVLVFRAHDGVDSAFLYYVLADDAFFAHATKSAKGTKMPRGDKRAIMDYTVRMPNLPTQRKIAAILSSLDDKIENNNAICKNLEEQLKCLFDLRFRDMIDSRGMSQYTPLASLCERITKGTTPTTLGLPFVDEGINFIKAESITDKHIFDWHRFAKIGPDTHTALNRSQLSENDILFSIAGTLGRFALVDKTILPANTNQAVAIIRADKNKVEPEYLYSFFLAGWHHEYCQKRVQQAVQANLSLTTIKSMPIIMLDEPARREYVAQISPIMQMISQRQLENRSLAILRDALLPKLMSGEIQPKTTSK